MKGALKMKKIISILGILIILSLSVYLMINERTYIDATDNRKGDFTIEIKSSEAFRGHPMLYNGALWKLMGGNKEKVIEQLGEPSRKDSSYYGYDWWIYLKDESIIQIAVEDNKVVSIFGMGKDVDLSPFQLEDSYSNINKDNDLKKQITFDNYQFQLTREDLQTRPLLQIDENTFAIMYFDKETKKLISIRIVNQASLLALRPYELYYSGDLPQVETLKEDEMKDVFTNTEKQIFDISNILRKNMERGKLKWNEKAQVAAKSHSEDMYKNKYFSHYAEDGSNLGNRLNKVGANYLLAGENIAAQYPDAISAVHGWLNSPGHREVLLNKDYTELGVGVHEFYFTQNFLKQ